MFQLPWFSYKFCCLWLTRYHDPATSWWFQNQRFQLQQYDDFALFGSHQSKSFGNWLTDHTRLLHRCPGNCIALLLLSTVGRLSAAAVGLKSVEGVLAMLPYYNDDEISERAGYDSTEENAVGEVWAACIVWNDAGESCETFKKCGYIGRVFLFSGLSSE